MTEKLSTPRNLSLTEQTSAYQFGPKTVIALPDSIVRELGIGDGQVLDVAIQGDRITLSKKEAPQIACAS